MRKVRRLLWGLPFVRSIAYAWHDRQFSGWRKSNPGRTYAEYYAARTEKRLRSGRPHLTLGGRGWDRDRNIVEWDAQSFAERDLPIWGQILALGLRRDMRCVDYGCGSLRIGQHVMRFLDAGNYFGIDVVPSFIDAGKAVIDPELLKAKRPLLAVIDPDTIAEIGVWKPDFIFSVAVLQHVPPSELGTFFARLEAMMEAGTRAYILFIAADRLKRARTMSWSYPFEYLRGQVMEFAPDLELELLEPRSNLGPCKGGKRQILAITKHEATARSVDRRVLMQAR